MIAFAEFGQGFAPARRVTDTAATSLSLRVISVALDHEGICQQHLGAGPQILLVNVLHSIGVKDVPRSRIFAGLEVRGTGVLSPSHRP